MTDLFAGTGLTVDDTFKKNRDSLKPRSFRTGKVFTVKNITRHHPVGISANVIGFIEGIDPVWESR